MDSRALELTGTRVYKPWYYIDFTFSIYLRLIGQQNIYENIKELPNKVSILII